MPKSLNFISTILLLSITISFISCDDNTTQNKKETEEKSEGKKLTSLNWILGKWKGEYKGNAIYEVWKKTSDTAYHGHSYYIVDGDTNHIEKLRLEVFDNEIYYSADLPQNKQIVSFLLISEKPNEVIFENKHNEYPQRINYRFQQPDNLYAKISGTVKETLQEDEFFYKKVD